MSYNLKPYPEYKSSGVLWLGEVPAHWEVLPNRAIFSEVINKNCPNDPLLSVTISRGVIRQSELTAHSSKKDSSNEDKSNYKLVLPGDITYNKMRAWQGAIGVSSYRGIVSPAYIVVRSRNDQNSKYFHYLFRTPSFAKEAERWSYGITSDQWSLRAEHFKMIYSLLPSLQEQDAIVEFLDYIDSIIWHYIRAKRHLIELLNEQKQAIIQQAVTRGLDPNVHLKPSGVEWLGDVPEHWEVFALKHAFSCMDYGISEASTDSGTVRVLTMGNIKDRAVTIPATGGVLIVDERLILQPGDLLFNRTNSAKLVGKVGLFSYSRSDVTFASYLVRLRNNGRSVPEFMNYLLNSPSILNIARRLAIPSLHQSNLNPTRYGRINIALPPVNEQRAIVKYLDYGLAPLESLQRDYQKQIDFCREYRTRLITDVVTGKLDVRSVDLSFFGLPEYLESMDDSSENLTEEDQELPEELEDADD